MRVVLASFDRVPSAKGASQHILANAEILMAEHHVSLVSLGAVQCHQVHRHLPLQIQETNWLRRALAFRAQLLDVFSTHVFDAYHVRSPWEGLAVPAGRPLIYEVNGLPSIELPYHYEALHTQPAVIAQLRHLEDALIDRADVLITPSAVTRGYLLDRGADAKTIALVPNRPSFAPLDAPIPRRPGPLRLCYIGTLTAWQGLPDLFRALRPIERPFTLTIATAARKRERKLIERLARKAGVMTEIVDAVPAQALGAFLQQHDIGLAPLTPCARNLMQGCMPIKLLDYMAAGLPILAPNMPVVTDVLGANYPTYRRYSRRAATAMLDRLLSDAQWRKTLSAQGLQRVRRFSAAVQADALRAAYAPIVSANQAS